MYNTRLCFPGIWRDIQEHKLKKTPFPWQIMEVEILELNSM
jgi:hypothetical protein